MIFCCDVAEHVIPIKQSHTYARVKQVVVHLLVLVLTCQWLMCACQQDVVTRARGALLDTRLTGEATLPANPGSHPHPAIHNGGFYMGEVSQPDLQPTFNTIFHAHVS